MERGREGGEREREGGRQRERRWVVCVCGGGGGGGVQMVDGLGNYIDDHVSS